MSQPIVALFRGKHVWDAVLLFIQHFLISRIRFLGIKKWILDIKKYFWYQEVFDIKNSIFWYQEFDFLISRNNKYFLISRIRFPDIKNSNWYQENEFLISKNAYLNIKNSTSWYQEIIHISWYQKIEFLISRNRFLDIKKCILSNRFTIY